MVKKARQNLTYRDTHIYIQNWGFRKAALCHQGRNRNVNQ